MKVLIVDDDAKFRAFLEEVLTGKGHACETAEDVKSAKRLIEKGLAGELILLDVMMPDQSGWELLEWLRERGDQTPVIFVTARHAVEERVKGLQLGADDYIIKPFEYPELLARVDAVVRRHQKNRRITVGDLVIDTERHVVQRGDKRIEVSPREYAVLLTLARAEGKVIDRETLLREVWGMEFDPGTNVVNVQIARLRKKIDLPDIEPLIKTVIGRGYALREDGA